MTTPHMTAPSCPEHSHCAFTGTEDERCPFCHASWAKVTAPGTETITRHGVTKAGKRTTVQETRSLFGFGQTPYGHMLGHVAAMIRYEKSAAKSRAKQAAA